MLDISQLLYQPASVSLKFSISICFLLIKRYMNMELKVKKLNS